MGARPTLALPAAVAEGEDGQQVEPGQRLRKTGGRKPGSLNKRTQAYLDAYEASGYLDPRQFWAECISRDTAALAKTLGCKRKDAFAFQLQAARDLAPYVAQKVPVAIVAETQSVGMLVLGRVDPGSEAARQVENMGVPLAQLPQNKPKQNQGVSDGDLFASHDGASHDDGQAIDVQGKTGDETID